MTYPPPLGLGNVPDRIKPTGQTKSTKALTADDVQALIQTTLG